MRVTALDVLPLRRAQRLDRYEQVTVLRVQGFGNAEIARRVGLTARTLQNWQKQGSFPEAGRRSPINL